MRNYLLAALAGLILATSQATAIETAIDDAARDRYLTAEDIAPYLEARTGLVLDDKCFYLKRAEHQAIAGLAQDVFERTGLYADSLSGTISTLDFADLVDALDAQARSQADALDCAGTALPVLAELRNRAAQRLFVSALVALEGNRSGQMVVRPFEQEAVQVYGGMLQQFYGESFPGFLDWAKTEARTRLEAAGHVLDAGEAAAEAPALGLGNPGLDALWSSAATSIRALALEVAVEGGGRRLRGDSPSSGGLETLADAGGTPQAFIWQSVPLYVTGSRDRVESVWTVSPDGDAARVMLYGLAPDAVTRAVLFAHAAPVTGYDAFASAQWRDGATRFEAEPAADACLGGPCFDLPPALVETLVRGPADVWIEIVLLPTSDTPLPARESPETNPVLTTSLPRWRAATSG